MKKNFKQENRSKMATYSGHCVLLVIALLSVLPGKKIKALKDFSHVLTLLSGEMALLALLLALHTF